MGAPPINHINRRQFLKVSAATGAGLTLAVYFPAVAQDGQTGPAPFEPNAFIRIHTDDSVTVIIKHIEFGQGTYTGLATLVAEELDADWAKIRCEHAPADASRYNNLNFGPIQGTGGSSAIANSYEQLRRAGATAKHMLRMAAAETWKVPVGEITVHNGIVRHDPSGRTSGFGQLAEAAARQVIPEQVSLKDPKDFVYIGKEVTRKDIGKTNGTAIFTQDINLPGQLTAMVAHAPVFGAKVESFDATATRQLAGVVDVIEIASGVAVIAGDYWSAKKGRDLLKVQWDDSGAFKMGSAQIMDQYKQMAETPGTIAKQQGDTTAAFEQAAKVLEVSYEFPYLAHATMEPMNCVVRIDDNACDLWYGSQLQTVDQMNVATLLGLTPAQVNIHTLYAGGSFGRRANPVSDYVLEAVHIAKILPQGTPVKLVWSREDDMRAGYFRPMYYHTIKAALDADGNPTAWQQRIVGQSIVTGTAFGGMVQNGVDPTSVEGASNLPYHVPNLLVDLHTPDNINVPVLWWRSVGSTHTAYSTETFIDELAYAAGKDPVAYRMQLLRDHPRHQGVLKLAADKAGWGTPLPQNRFRGVAVHESFNSFVAQVAEVSLTPGGGFKVERVVCAVDCGVAVNPDIIHAQMEGGIGYGLSPVLASEITVEQGGVVQSNFHDYGVLRINQMPAIEVHIVPSTEPPTGVGEPGTPVIAPAVANALFAATGRGFTVCPYGLPKPETVYLFSLWFG